ncbi:MAG: hypothetical protein JXR76_24145 [Deltaproteobacteria bacterium]|nr:hypothetical protein [Deltaproteobacteria bacterium]
MSARCSFVIAIMLCLSGCGGAAAVGEDVIQSGNAGSTSMSSKPDKKAEEAGKYCAHEIETAKNTPNELLNKKQIGGCLLALRPQIRTDCAKNLPPGGKKEVVLKIIIGKDGNVVGVFPIGDNADSAEATCVAGKVKPVSFPQFTAKDQQVVEKYPFSVEP